MDKNITTFIFDCFKVFFSPPLSDWYERNITKTGHIDPNYVNIIRDFDLGNLSEDGLFDYLLNHDWIKTTKQELRDEIVSLCVLDMKLVEVVNQIRSKGYKVALLSNAGHELFEREIYRLYPYFKDLFDKIVISSEIKMVKPDPEIYLYTLDFIDSKPEECFFVDDNNENVTAAENLGIKSFVYTDVQSFVEYLETNKFL